MSKKTGFKNKLVFLSRLKYQIVTYLYKIVKN